MSVSPAVKEVLTIRIAGEIILSNDPGATMKKWRELFNITQIQLADRLGVSPSVISDYESGRRRSPGTRFVKRFVGAIVGIDEMEGGHFIRELSRLTATPADAILDLREFPVPIKAKGILQAVKGVILACGELLDRDIYGYTIIDSIRAIQTLSGTDFYQLFGSTTERAAIFTNVTHGRSPMVAIRVHPLKPRMVVVHGLAEVDPLAVLLAEIERIPLVLSRADSEEELVRRMSELYRSVTSERMRGA